MSTAAYQYLVEKAQEMGWPKNYKNDLEIHDRNFLTNVAAPKTFVGILHVDGTHLYRAATADDPHVGGGGEDKAYGYNWREQLVDVFSFFSSQPEGQYHYFFWNGPRLLLEDCATAEEALARSLAQSPDYRKCQCYACQRKRQKLNKGV